MKCRKTKKIKYKDELDAKIALAFIQNKREAREETRIYYCKYCKGYHTTSKQLKGVEGSE